MSQININNEPSAEVIIDENGTPVTVIIGGGGAMWGTITGTLSDQTDLQTALDSKVDENSPITGATKTKITYDSKGLVTSGTDATVSDISGLQTALDAKVPYSGATGNVNLGEYGISTGYVQLDTTPTTYTPAVGNLGYNDTVGTLETTLKGGTVQLKIGRDMFERVVNKTGVQLTKASYQAVRISDAQGQRLAVALAQANNDNNSADTLGLAVETIDNNQEGNIFTLGEISGINTTGSLQGETWADGDVLYLSPTVAGRVSNVKPVAPQHLVIIGYVVYSHQNNGKIYIKVMNGWELGELHDVNTTGATAGQVLKYNGTIWAPSADAGVTGSGNTDYVAKFTGTGTIGNSVIRVSGTDATYFSTNKASGSDGNNIFIGGGGQFLTSVPGSPTLASYNVALGINALLANTEGNESIAIGYNALTSNTVGTQNSALGYQSLASNIQGFRNTSVGYFSLFSNSSGYENTSVGANALFSSNSSGNSAFGVYSLFLNTDGFDNTGLGKYALYTNSTGDENSAVGSFSLRFNTLGNRNTGLGFESLRSNTTANDNVGIGYRAGLTNTTGSNNIFLGSNSGGVSITESNRTWIGNSSTTSTWLGGNLLLGSTTDAGQRLQVTGNVNFGGTTGLTWDNTNKRLGIATNNPGSALTVQAANGLYAIEVRNSVGDNRGGLVFASASNNLTLSLQNSSGSENVLLDSNGKSFINGGNLLLGTTTDVGTSILTMSSTSKGFLRPRMTTVQRDAIVSPATGLSIYNTTTNKVNYYNGTAWTEIQDTITNPVTGTGISGQVSYWSGPNTQAGSNNLFWDNTNGRLGIGTNSPSFALQVQSDAQINGVRVGRGAGNVISNAVVGSGAGSSMISGTYCSFFGTDSGSATTGSSNSFFGGNSGLSTTSGANNSFFGVNAGVFNTTGGNNILIGFEAGRRISSGSNLTVANNSTFVGYDTRANANSETNQTVVGYQAIGLGSNTTVIGNSSTTFGRWWGNLLIGSSVNGGQALQITGLSSFTGTTASDGGQLGSELLSASGWTSTGWTGSFGAGYTHTVGNTSVLSNTLAAVNGTYYQIQWTVTGRTAGSFTIAFGGYSAAGQTSTTTVGPRATSTGTLQITPTSDFDGTIVMSIRAISASSGSIQLRVSNGTITNEIRTDSTRNAFFGLNAGSRNLQNSATGTGLDNTFLGSEAGINNTTSTGNTFVGRLAGGNNTLGAANSFFGLNSGNANIGGSFNSFFGWNSGFSNTGSNNSFFGREAGYNHTSGDGNSFYGIRSGLNSTTASGNSFYGRESGSNNTTGSNNIAIGLDSGRRISGGGNLTVANTSIFIGRDTRANADSETNQIVIGDSAIGLGSNTTVIGNSSTTFGRWWGNLLVGTSTNSGFALDVNGTARIQNNLRVTKGGNNYIDLDANANGSNSFIRMFASGIIDANIYTTTAINIGRPNLDAGFSFRSGSTNTTSIYAKSLGVDGGLIALTNTGANSELHISSPSGFSNFVSFRENVVSDRGVIGFQNGTSYFQIRVNGATNMTNGTFSTAFFSNGNVGINTTTDAGFKLDVNGTARVQGDFTHSDATNIIFGTTTGTKIGTATSQKLAFWNATPIVQPTTGVASATRVGGAGTTVTDTDTFDGYTLAQIVKALRNTGILA